MPKPVLSLLCFVSGQLVALHHTTPLSEIKQIITHHLCLETLFQMMDSQFTEYSYLHLRQHSIFHNLYRVQRAENGNRVFKCVYNNPSIRYYQLLHTHCMDNMVQPSSHYEMKEKPFLSGLIRLATGLFMILSKCRTTGTVFKFKKTFQFSRAGEPFILIKLDHWLVEWNKD